MSMCAVEWKKLGDVCKILDSQRKPISKSKRVFGSYPYYGANGIQDYVDGYIFDGTYLLIGEDGSVINKDNSPVLHWVSGQFWVNNHAHILSDIKDAAILKYLYYVLHTIDVSDIVRGVPPKLNQENLKNIILPIPSLAKQQEIVSHLDTFTTLISNLESEFDMRRKQYEHYRNQLLDFEGVEGVEWKSLGENVQVLRGRRLTKSDLLQEGKYQVFHGGLEPLGYYNLNNREADSVMIINVGASAGTVGYCNKDFWSSDGCFTLSKNPLILPKYLYCYLKQQERKISSKVRKAGIPTLDAKVIEDINIPLIPLAKQIEIVSKLDAFENLIQSLEQEIKLRKQQYEYYREKLLTFEKE